MADTICDDPADLAGLSTPTRNRYFYGKLLDAFHFDLEQSYLNRKRWLLNRLGLGSGVLCGLNVVPSSDGAGIVIAPGVAVDPYGREIVVPVPSPPIDPRQPTDACGMPSGEPVAPGTEVTICLAYHECEAEQVPAMVCDCDGQEGCQASSIRERYMVLVQAQAPQPGPAGCDIAGLYVKNPKGTGLAVSHPVLVDRVSAACADPSAACVTLAKVTVPAAGSPVTDATIDRTPRPVVYSNELLFEMIECLAEQAGGGGQPPQPAPKLTRIVKTSWKHDGKHTYNEFAEGLAVSFEDTVSAPRSVRAWFLVSVELPALSPAAKGGPSPGTILVHRVLDRGISWSSNTVTFVPHPDFEATYQGLVKSTDQPILCRVVLKCDFLKGPNGMAVDGNHLLGTLPTGDGVPGGDFESWFALTPRPS